jgi:hypothetical protein
MKQPEADDHSSTACSIRAAQSLASLKGLIVTLATFRASIIKGHKAPKV